MPPDVKRLYEPTALQEGDFVLFHGKLVPISKNMIGERFYEFVYYRPIKK